MKPRRKWSSARGQGEGIRWLRDHVVYPHDDCLVWPLACDDKGYGIVGYLGKVYKAARLMCELAKGPPPNPGDECAHSCGRGHRGCVNPRHLSWKTRSANQRDRRRHGTHGKPGVAGRSKLTPNEIALIRNLAKSTTHRALALRFNCSPSNISKIVHGARWKKTPRWLSTGLTRNDLEAIRNAKGIKSGAELARQYGVDDNVIYRIQRGRPYEHIR